MGRVSRPSEAAVGRRDVAGARRPAAARAGAAASGSGPRRRSRRAAPRRHPPRRLGQKLFCPVEKKQKQKKKKDLTLFFCTRYVAPSCSSTESFVAACAVVAAGMERHRHRALLAAVLTAAGQAEARLRELTEATARRALFGALLAASEGAHRFLIVLDELEGGYSPSPWQQLGPEAQLAALPQLFDPAAEALVAAATQLVETLDNAELFPGSGEMWGQNLAHLKACLNNVLQSKNNSEQIKSTE